jgi:hypothetical protein
LGWLREWRVGRRVERDSGVRFRLRGVGRSKVLIPDGFVE